MPGPQHPAPADSDELGGIALFFDVENILLGIQGDFNVGAVTRFLGERGEVMTLRAYADWGRYRRQQRTFLDEGVQMVFLPSYGQSDKNRTDTAICVDAMEILFTRPLIDTFCIVSGDSDFSILAQRLRDHGKRVIGVSARSAASPVLVKQCHEFVFYETLIGQRVAGFSVEEGEARVKKALERVVEEVGAVFRAGVLKDRMRKQDPTFSERNYGAHSFTRFLANYDHLVTVGEGGMVSVASAPEGTLPEARGQARSEDKREREARAVLTRTVLEAARRHGAGPIPLSRLKDTMQAVAPDFDELALGHKSFTRFLLHFPEIVVVDRAANSARPHEAVLAAGEGAPEAPAAVPERRRRAKKGREGEGEEAADAAAVRAEAVRAEAVRAEAVRAEAVRAEAVRAEAVRAEAVRAEAVRAEAVKAEALKAEALKAEAVKAEVVKAGAVKAEVVKAEVVKAEAVKAEVVKAEAVKAEAVKANAVKAEALKESRAPEVDWVAPELPFDGPDRSRAKAAPKSGGLPGLDS